MVGAPGTAHNGGRRLSVSALTPSGGCMPGLTRSDRRSNDRFETELAHLQVATADGGSLGLSALLSPVLKLVREHLGMDVVFVAQFVEHDSVFRHVETAPDQRVIEPGQSYARERSYCQRVVDGRLPPIEPNVPARADFEQLPTFDFPIGCYLSVPIRLHGGRLYGVLCCFSFAPSEDLSQRDLRRLEMAAELATRLIEESGS
jgi:GAF domain-containing protein